MCFWFTIYAINSCGSFVFIIMHQVSINFAATSIRFTFVFICSDLLLLQLISAWISLSVVYNRNINHNYEIYRSKLFIRKISIFYSKFSKNVCIEWLITLHQILNIKIKILLSVYIVRYFLWVESNCIFPPITACLDTLYKLHLKYWRFLYFVHHILIIDLILYFPLSIPLLTYMLL